MRVLIGRARVTVKAIFIFSSIVIGGLIVGCGSNTGHPDVSKTKLDLSTRRLDVDLAKLDTNNVAAGLAQLSGKYPDFLGFYLDTLMGFGIHGNYQDTVAGIRLGLKPFLSHKDIRGLFDTVAAHYPDTKNVDEQISEAFRYMKHYYPAFPIPKIVYLVTGLNQWSVITVDTSIVGIGLDMYLGQQYPFYSAVQIPAYVIRKCTPQYIATNMMQAIYRDRRPLVGGDRNLLDMILQMGKEQYFLSKMLPETPDTVRIGFTKAQLDWCEANEAEVYNFFVTKNLFYETNPNKVIRFISDGPNTAGMPPEAPGNVGTWLGYRIIKSYTDQHPDYDLNKILAAGDPQRILQESKYKPK